MEEGVQNVNQWVEITEKQFSVQSKETFKPNNAHGPISEPVSVLLYMVKGLQRCDKVNDLKMGRLQGYPCNHKASYKREAGMSEKDVKTNQRSHSEKELRVPHCWFWKQRKGLQAKKCRWLLEAGIGKEIDSPLEFLKGMQPCGHLGFSRRVSTVDF